MKTSSNAQEAAQALVLQRDDPTLASLVKYAGCTQVTFPTEHAAEAAKALFDRYWMEEVLIFDHLDGSVGDSIPEGQWCLAFPETPDWEQKVTSFLFLPEELPIIDFLIDDESWIGLLFSQDTLLMKPRRTHHALEALDRARMDAVPKGSLPAPWVMQDAPTDALFDRDGAEQDAFSVDVQGLDDPTVALPALPDIEEVTTSSVLTNDELETVFATVCRHLQLPSFAFVIRRGQIHKHGFVTGQVCYDVDGRPLRMVITTCPNADLAEASATILHEFAHLMALNAHHGRAFKQVLVELAEALYGVAYFGEARARIDESYRVVDLWIAVGIRASLLHRTPPVSKHPEEVDITRAVGQIQMLRALASDQLGTPEGINATGIANTKIATHGLEEYQIKLDLTIDDQMVDTWIDVGKRVLWRRQLMHAVSEFCDVFTLSLSSRGWMHLFGKHQDIVTAEYLYDVCFLQIERRWELHKETWKQAQRELGEQVSGGRVRSEKTSFCQQAVKGLRERMENERKQRISGSVATSEHQQRADGLRQAESFAEQEHYRRGLRWVGGSSTVERANQSGYEAGRSIQFNVGIADGRATRGLLSD